MGDMADIYVPPVTITAAPPLRVSGEVRATGLLCELALISSLAFDAPSTVGFSFSLPYAEPKYDALLACFTTPRVALPLGGVAVIDAMEYDSRYDTGRPISADLWPTVDTLTIPDALAGDPYFAGSYWQTRYDDFPRADPRLQDLVSWNGAGDTGYTRAAADNCVMLSAEWHANRVYTLELSYTNPPAPSGGAAPGELGLWIAPLSGETATLGGDGEWADEASWSYAIRGHKYGTTCGTDDGGDTALRAAAGASFSAASAQRDVQDFTFGNANNALSRTPAGLTSLAEELCDTYSAEKTRMEAGTMSDQLVPGAMWRAFLLDATALVDWQLVHETNVSLYPRALDGRRPGFPTREHGIGSRCASIKGACNPDSGRLIDVRTVGARRKEENIPAAQTILNLLGHTGGTFDPSLADRRYRSLYTFGLIGEVLYNSAARYKCTELLLTGSGSGGSGGSGGGDGGDETFYLGNERGGAWPTDISEL